uniref:Uncharacterized protein n=1 Tax=Ananas comosus var. bracteatus TaxID=296719 RepID=A0A6V7PL73_ANACO|nr:unnamed protein product [Ananas comosus var. bracteatus]
MLGLAHQSNRGHLGVKYYGRTVTVTILPVGVDMAQLRSVVAAPEALATLRDLSLAFKDRIVLLGVDDIDLFKGIGLKFLAMERLLEKRPELRGRAVLVQIVNPARSHGRDVEEVADEAVPSPAVHLGAARPPLPSSRRRAAARSSRGRGALLVLAATLLMLADVVYGVVASSSPAVDLLSAALMGALWMQFGFLDPDVQHMPLFTVSARPFASLLSAFY